MTALCKTYYVDPQTGRDTNYGLTPEKPLEYGKSITDACIGWDDSAAVLEVLSKAVLQRRG